MAWEEGEEAAWKERYQQRLEQINLHLREDCGWDVQAVPPEQAGEGERRVHASHGRLPAVGHGQDGLPVLQLRVGALRPEWTNGS
jgi:hypothetical protein